VLADNRIALNAGWDPEMLRFELKDLSALGADLSLLGFDEKELAAALAPEGAPGLTDADDVPEVSETTVSRIGDIWCLGPHRVACGNCTDRAAVGALLGPVVPPLMVTDPPYGVEYDPEWRARAGLNKNKAKLGKVNNDDRADWREAWRLFPGSVAYVWSAPGPLQVESFDGLIAAGFQVRQQIIWAKDRFALGRGHYHYQHEPCWYAVRDKGNWSGDRSQSTLWEVKSRDDSGHGHGTQKPVECMRRPILNNSSPGQAIYDPFLGSGTTVIAAETTGRVCLGMEIDPRYVDVAVRRWQAFTGDKATLDGDGRTFDAIAEIRLGEMKAECDDDPHTEDV
jgi:DNA modification methylase